MDSPKVCRHEFENCTIEVTKHDPNVVIEVNEIG